MIDVAQLYSVFDTLPTDRRCFLIDTFATTCFLHQQGHETAARKLLRDLFSQVNYSRDDEVHELLKNTLNTLSGNEKSYALAVPLRVEFRALFNP